MTQPSNFFSRYGAFSGTFVVPAATMNAPHDSASLPSRQPERVGLAAGSAGSPETSRRIGQLPAASAGSRAIDAVAPPGPFIAIVCTGSSGLLRPPIAKPTPNSTIAATATAAIAV